MAETIQLRILTPEGVALTDEAVSVVAPGGVGSLGILRHHAPLVTTIAPGPLSWTTPGGDRRQVALEEGLLEITHNALTILTARLTQPEAQAPAGYLPV